MKINTAVYKIACTHVSVSETYIINPTTYLFLETRRIFLFILDLQKPVFSFHYFGHPCHAVVGGEVGICSCTRSHIFHSGIILICYSPFPTWWACSRPHDISLCKCPLIYGFENIFLDTNLVYFTTVEAIFEEFWFAMTYYLTSWQFHHLFPVTFVPSVAYGALLPPGVPPGRFSRPTCTCDQTFFYEWLLNCMGPHTINAANVGSSRDLISKKTRSISLAVYSLCSFFGLPATGEGKKEFSFFHFLCLPKKERLTADTTAFSFPILTVFKDW